MGQIDWDKLMKLDMQELQDDVAAAEEMFCDLSDVCSLMCYITLP